MFFVQTGENLTHDFETFLQNRRKYSIFAIFFVHFFATVRKFSGVRGRSPPDPLRGRTPYLEPPPRNSFLRTPLPRRDKNINFVRFVFLLHLGLNFSFKSGQVISSSKLCRSIGKTSKRRVKKLGNRSRKPFNIEFFASNQLSRFSVKRFLEMGGIQ